MREGSPSSALHMRIFLVGNRLSCGVPFKPCGESRAAARKTRNLYNFDDLFGSQIANSLLKRLIAACGNMSLMSVGSMIPQFAKGNACLTLEKCRVVGGDFKVGKAVEIGFHRIRDFVGVLLLTFTSLFLKVFSVINVLQWARQSTFRYIVV